MDTSACLDQAIALSEQIIRALQSEDWDRIAALDDERNVLIKEYFTHANAIDSKKTARLKTLNDQIVSQLIKLQQTNRHQQQGLSQAQKVSRAYLENT